jgi:hypothetical protein
MERDRLNRRRTTGRRQGVKTLAIPQLSVTRFSWQDIGALFVWKVFDFVSRLLLIILIIFVVFLLDNLFSFIYCDYDHKRIEEDCVVDSPRGSMYYCDAISFCEKFSSSCNEVSKCSGRFC